MTFKKSLVNRVVLPGLAMTALLLTFQNCGGNFQSANSTTEQTTLNTPTGAPVLSAVLGWDKSTSANIKGYRNYLRAPSGQADQVIDVGATANPALPEYEVQNLDAQSTYYAVVKAYDVAGLESAASNEIEISAK